ncbi:MAG TPA: 16S rRNA (guanine(527)-N(7))-methyltransferase RsmG [Chitinophagaceae bacterium]|nr:16S rRNA (guanine(527)-N(7))-methyltransferase RsmG [Chitinophagaceae bacterium]
MEIIRQYFDGLTEGQISRFAALKPLYQQWNAKINVISRKDLDNLYEKHVLHSLAIAAIAEFTPGSTVLDIGTGGGFPGLPLAIFYPDCRFCLVDSKAKKIRVVREMIRALSLENTEAIPCRVEDIRDRRFDFTVSRATASLGTLWAWSLPLLKKGRSSGLSNGLISLKGGDLSAEVSQSPATLEIFEIHSLFSRDFFREKYLVHIPY